MGPLELARYDQGVAKAIQDEQIRLKQLAIGTREYKNKLAALLQSALRPKAGLLLKKLMAAQLVRARLVAHRPGESGVKAV